MKTKAEKAAYARAWRAKNHEKHRKYMRAYQRTNRAGGWPPGRDGDQIERLFVNALRGVLGLDDLPVTSQWGTP